MANKKKIRTRGDIVMDITVGVLLTLIMIVTMYPLIYVVSCSISSPYAELMDNYRPYLPTEIWEEFSPTAAEAEERDYIWTDIQSFLNESIAGFITGSISLDTWDQYVETIKGMDIDRYMEIYNDMYTRYKAAQ